MTLSIRHFAAAPLLVVGLINFYVLVESLQGEPQAQIDPSVVERTAWIGGRLFEAAFALYFFASYFLIVARKYAVMAVLTLWAWHLFILSPFLAPCEGYRNLDHFRQMMGFGVQEFAIATALVAIASSFALYLRYRVVNGPPALSRLTFLRLSVGGATIVSVALVVGAYWIVPLLREAYSRTDLPIQTLVFFATYQYWLVLSLACVVGLLYVRMKVHYSEAQLQIALDGAVGLIVLLNVFSSVFVSAALGPLRTLGCAV